MTVARANAVAWITQEGPHRACSVCGEPWRLACHNMDGSGNFGDDMKQALLTRVLRAWDLLQNRPFGFGTEVGWVEGDYTEWEREEEQEGEGADNRDSTAAGGGGGGAVSSTQAFNESVSLSRREQKKAAKENHKKLVTTLAHLQSMTTPPPTTPSTSNSTLASASSLGTTSTTAPSHTQPASSTTSVTSGKSASGSKVAGTTKPTDPAKTAKVPQPANPVTRDLFLELISMMGCSMIRDMVGSCFIHALQDLDTTLKQKLSPEAVERAVDQLDVLVCSLLPSWIQAYQADATATDPDQSNLNAISSPVSTSPPPEASSEAGDSFAPGDIMIQSVSSSAMATAVPGDCAQTSAAASGATFIGSATSTNSGKLQAGFVEGVAGMVPVCSSSTAPDAQTSSADSNSTNVGTNRPASKPPKVRSALMSAASAGQMVSFRVANPTPGAALTTRNLRDLRDLRDFREPAKELKEVQGSSSATSLPADKPPLLEKDKATTNNPEVVYGLKIQPTTSECGGSSVNTSAPASPASSVTSFADSDYSGYSAASNVSSFSVSAMSVITTMSSSSAVSAMSQPLSVYSQPLSLASRPLSTCSSSSTSSMREHWSSIISYDTLHTLVLDAVLVGCSDGSEEILADSPLHRGLVNCSTQFTDALARYLEHLSSEVFQDRSLIEAGMKSAVQEDDDLLQTAARRRSLLVDSIFREGSKHKLAHVETEWWGLPLESRKACWTISPQHFYCLLLEVLCTFQEGIRPVTADPSTVTRTTGSDAPANGHFVSAQDLLSSFFEFAHSSKMGHSSTNKAFFKWFTLVPSSDADPKDGPAQEERLGKTGKNCRQKENRTTEAPTSIAVARDVCAEKAKFATFLTESLPECSALLQTFVYQTAVQQESQHVLQPTSFEEVEEGILRLVDYSARLLFNTQGKPTNKMAHPSRLTSRVHERISAAFLCKPSQGPTVLSDWLRATSSPSKATAAESPKNSKQNTTPGYTKYGGCSHNSVHREELVLCTAGVLPSHNQEQWHQLAGVVVDFSSGAPASAANPRDLWLDLIADGNAERACALVQQVRKRLTTEFLFRLWSKCCSQRKKAQTLLRKKHFGPPEKLDKCDFKMCGKRVPASQLKLCSKCKVRQYCSRDCQVLHWKNGHRRECAIFCQFAKSCDTKMDGLASLLTIDPNL